MQKLLFLLVAVCFSLCFSAVACKNSANSTTVTDTKTGMYQPMPKDADSAQVAFRDVNYWTENNLFCLAALVDNQSVDWKRIWVRVEILDSAGQVLLVKGDSSLIVRALADAIPPHGASAFFLDLLLEDISGTPVSCRLTGAGSSTQDVGPILLPGVISGVRVQKPDPEDPTKVLELAYQISANIENPLSLQSDHPRLVFLLYGKDLKLYFVQMLNPEDPKPVVKMEPMPPIWPNGKSHIFCPIVYKQLPQRLQDTLIGRADIQVYDARE